MLAILGKKLGMTQQINAEGKLLPVTVLEAGPCVITEVKTFDKHGYKAAQLGYEDIQPKKISKASQANFDKKKITPKRYLKEIRLTPEENYEIGQEIKADVFKAGDLVDIQGTSIGKGFAGGMKRWHWRGGPGSHGSMFHRRVGSIGASSFPSRTWPGQRMPGHLGNVKKTVQNLEVIRVDVEKNLILVKGAVPGCENGFLFIRRSLKKPLGIPVKVVVKAKEKKDPLSKAAKKADTAKKK